MGKVRHIFRKLEIWNRTLKLSVVINKMTADFPKSEIYALSSQVRRAAVSSHSNIAEGSGRKTNKDFSNFLHYSIGSLFELESQLIYAREVNYLNENVFEQVENEIIEIQKMITSFENNLN